MWRGDAVVTAIVEVLIPSAFPTGPCPDHALRHNSCRILILLSKELGSSREELR